MFQFTRFATYVYEFNICHSGIPGSPFVCQLPQAFRRLPRPSSPSYAKTSPERPYTLDHMNSKLTGQSLDHLKLSRVWPTPNTRFIDQRILNDPRLT